MGRKNPFVPTLLLSEIYSPHALENGYFAKVIEDVAEEGFYKAVEVGSVHDTKDRVKIRNVVESTGLTLTQWMTNLIDSNNLDLSSIRQFDRKNAVNHIKDYMYLATECGAKNLAIVSGPFTGEENKEISTEAFYESLCELCTIAAEYEMNVLVEPLDRLAHKKKFMGPSDELFTLMERVKVTHSNIGVAFDTAHAALNGENIEESIKLLKPHIEQIHLSNAILDPKDPLYGDNHMKIGFPGFLHDQSIASFIRKAEELDLIGEKQVRISVEMRTLPHENAQETAAYAKQILERVSEQLAIKE